MITLSENKELNKQVIDRIKENGGYCPCALEHIEDTKCMCADFRDKIKKGYEGPCNCGLYISIGD